MASVESLQPARRGKPVWPVPLPPSFHAAVASPCVSPSAVPSARTTQPRRRTAQRAGERRLRRLILGAHTDDSVGASSRMARAGADNSTTERWLRQEHGAGEGDTLCSVACVRPRSRCRPQNRALGSRLLQRKRAERVASRRSVRRATLCGTSVTRVQSRASRLTRRRPRAVLSGAVRLGAVLRSRG